MFRWIFNSSDILSDFLLDRVSNRSENTVQHDATWANDGNLRTSDENMIQLHFLSLAKLEEDIDDPGETVIRCFMFDV